MQACSGRSGWSTGALWYPLALWCALALGACSLVPSQPAPPVQYDLGSPRLQAVADGPPVLLQDCTAPPWLDGNAMSYRLNWQDPLRLQAFRDSRWVAPPCAMLAQRLREVLPGSGAAGARILHLALDRFEQDFDSTSSSRVLVRLRATLVEPGATAVMRSRSFEMELAVSDPDAAHGVLALSRASDALLAELQHWVLAPDAPHD